MRISDPIPDPSGIHSDNKLLLIVFLSKLKMCLKFTTNISWYNNEIQLIVATIYIYILSKPIKRKENDIITYYTLHTTYYLKPITLHY